MPANGDAQPVRSRLDRTAQAYVLPEAQLERHSRADCQISAPRDPKQKGSTMTDTTLVQQVVPHTSVPARRVKDREQNVIPALTPGKIAAMLETRRAFTAVKFRTTCVDCMPNY